MNESVFLSASIVTYNNCKEAAEACRSILDHTKTDSFRLYIIDNASSDGTPEALQAIKGVTVIRQTKNIGFGAAHNCVLSLPLGKYHFVINPDILIDADVLTEFATFMEQNPDIVMAMPKILNPDGSEQKLPKETPTLGRLFLGRLAPLGGPFRRVRNDYTWADKQIDSVTDIDFCTGCFFCIRSNILKKLQGFDEQYFMYLEDADLTERAKEYGRVVINPAITVTHLWHRDSSKSLKLLLIHLSSSFKFLFHRKRGSN